MKIRKKKKRREMKFYVAFIAFFTRHHRYCNIRLKGKKGSMKGGHKEMNNIYLYLFLLDTKKTIFYGFLNKYVCKKYCVMLDTSSSDIYEAFLYWRASLWGGEMLRLFFIPLYIITQQLKLFYICFFFHWYIINANI